MSYIPVIDFGSCNPSAPISQQSLETVGGDLTHAFCSVGFAYLSNTGIFKEDVDKVNNATKSFFTAPTDVKNQYERNNDLNYGYSGLCVERVNLDRPADYKEAYDISGKAFFQDANEYKWP
uniref:Non-haem dioxygenase N-terminal domain-containing protein n=1 Tax=Ciona savignyi TaxID=51511 RepID=H2YCC6_CIOSA